MKASKCYLALFLLSCALPAIGQAQQHDQAKRRLLLRGATVHVGDGRVLPQTDVLLWGDRIAKVGKGLDAQGGAVMDAAGLHLAPGFMGSDTVLGLVEVNAVRSTRDQSCNREASSDTRVPP